jgi:hypothetical protein
VSGQDEDLPEIFFKPVTPAPTPLQQTQRTEVAMELHYSFAARKRKKQEERAARESVRSIPRGKSVFIRGEKVEKMRQWLLSMAAQGCAQRMDQFERSFCRDLWIRFNYVAQFKDKGVTRRPRKLTQKQFLCLRTIAAKYLALPAHVRNPRHRAT